MQVDNTFFSHPDKNYNSHIENIAQSFDESNHKVVAHYHDLGKLSNRFQEYISLKQKVDEDSKSFEKRRAKLKTTHTLESAYLYFCNEENRKDEFLANFFSILKHHGSLPDIQNDMNDYLSTIDNYIDDKRFRSIEAISKKSNIDCDDDIYGFMDFFEDSYEENFYQTIENFFLFKKRYSRLILADKFEAIFNKPYKNIDYLTESKIERYIQNMVDIVATKPINEFRNSAKKVIFDNYEKNKNSNIYLIKAPTGVGKTFIALELALKIAKDRGDKIRIITAIPFTSIIDQTHSEYEKILEGDSVLKYHHLTKYKKDNEDEKEQINFKQKVFLTDIWHEHFIVTTFNQLLYTIFSNHNRDNVRLETLRDSVIIVDEVQNIPRVLISSVVKVFERFAKEYNIHFIIMSATMPSFEGLLENPTVLSEDWFYDKKENRYRLHFKADINSFESLAEEINSSSNSVLCVVNTIDKAKRLFEKITDTDKYLLTTHQIPKHRKAIIRLIKYRLKKGHKIKLISTQLIEAGVDLDFDVGYREFAPFGSIIQMAGRVNREGNKGISDIFVFDFLEIEGQSEEIKKLPYRAIDLQEDDTVSWLETPLEEIEILENLESYFKKVKDETNSIDLEIPMKNLEFYTLFELLNTNFMPNQPWKVSLFIEQRYNHFNNFIKKRQEIFDSCDDKFEAINRVKDLEKDLGLYTISVNEKLLDHLSENIKFMFGRYILANGTNHYSKDKGFSEKLTRIEESLFD